MKNKYPEYKEFSEKEKEKICDNALIVFDANALLTLYRVSEKTADILFKSIENVKDRIWLPYHAGKELHKNRRNVINDKKQAYNNQITEFDCSFEFVENTRLNAKINSLTRTELTNEVEDFKKEIEQKKSEISKKIKEITEKNITRLDGLLKEDTILKRLEVLFENKVGECISADDYEKLYKEGKIRYNNEIPPGYKDKDKKENSYGDYIVWSEMLEKVEEGTPLIFVSDDVKEDWIWEINGRRYGARPELRAELWDRKKSELIIYTTDNFMKFFSTELDPKNVSVAMEEIKELPRKRKQTQLFSKENDVEIKQISSKYRKLNEILKTLNEGFNNLFNELSEGNEIINNFYISSAFFFDFSDRILDYIIDKSYKHLNESHLGDTISIGNYLKKEIYSNRNLTEEDRNLLRKGVDKVQSTLIDLDRHLSLDVE